MKKNFKCISVLLVFMLLLSVFSGCSLFGPSSIGTAKLPNGKSISIPFNDYLFNAYTNKQFGFISIMSYVKQNNAKISDILDQTSQDGKTKWGDYIKNYFKKSLEEAVILSEKFKELNLSLNDEDKTSINTTLQQLSDSLTTTVFAKLRAELKLTETDFKKLIEQKIKISKAITTLSEKGGLLDIPEADLNTAYSENVKIKHILISTQKDDGTGSGNKVDLTVAEIKDKEKIANDLLAQINKDTDYDTLMNEKSEDPGLQQNPDGYLFKKDGSMVKEFETAAFEMKVGDVRLVKTSLGFHIMKKFDITDTDKSTIKNNLQGVKYTSLMDEWSKTYTFTFDEKLIDKYSLVNLKDITA